MNSLLPTIRDDFESCDPDFIRQFRPPAGWRWPFVPAPGPEHTRG